MPAPPDSFTGRHRFLVTAEEAGERLDRFLTAHLPGVSRARVQELIDEGRARVAGIKRKRSHAVEEGVTVEVDVQPRPSPESLPEPIPIEVLFEDDGVAVVNKPSGMIVHAGAGAARGTLVNALLHRFQHLSSIGGPARPGIVHRLDKGTSGAMVVALDDRAHERIAEQFRARQVQKTYVALVHGRLKEDSGRIDLPVARDLLRRTRMTTRRREGREARTSWRVLLRLDGFTLVEAELHTGRTHQLRVHFAALGHPVVGDSLYGAPHRLMVGGRILPQLGRIFLHAARVRFAHPRRGDPVEARAPLPEDLRRFLVELAGQQGVETCRVDAAVREYL